jgi:hypothetical protein
MKMWAIIQSDLIYNYKRILLNLFLFALFTISVVFGIEALNETNPFAKAYWPVIVSMGSVLLVAISYKIALKEGRSRIFLLLPLELKKVAYARLTAGAVQLTAGFLYLLIVHQWLIKEWAPITERLVYSFSTFTYLLSAMLFSYYYVRRLKNLRMFLKVILGVAIYIIFMLIMFYTDYVIFQTIPRFVLSIIYFSLGMFFYFGCGYLYMKQNSFLEKVLFS